MQFSIFAWDGIFFVLMARQILYISQNFYFFNAFFYNTNQLEQSCFFTPIIIDKHVHFIHTIYPKGLQENTQRGNPTQNGLSQRKWNVFFFSVYSHINTDYKITVPQERKSTQSTSTVMNKFLLCTTESADPVQWIEQLYNEDVS